MHSCCVLSDNLWMERKTVGPPIWIFPEESGFIYRSLFHPNRLVFRTLFLSHVGRSVFVFYPAEQDNLVHPRLFPW